MCTFTFSPLPFCLMVNAKGFPQDSWKELKKEKKNIASSQCIILAFNACCLLYLNRFPKDTH